jgi:hypothetical protein
MWRFIHARSQASAEVYMNSSVFWVITQHRVVKHRRFGTIYLSQLHESSTQEESRVAKMWHPILAPRLSSWTLDPWGWDRQVVPKRRCLTDLRCVITQKTKEFNIHTCVFNFVYLSRNPNGRDKNCFGHQINLFYFPLLCCQTFFALTNARRLALILRSKCPKTCACFHVVSTLSNFNQNLYESKNT